MITILKQLCKLLIVLLKSKNKWLLILFALWLYRVDFIQADGGGLAKGLQVISILGMLLFVMNKSNNIVGISYMKSNLPVKSILYFYTLAVASTLWAFSPTFAFFLSFQNLVLIFVLVWVFGQIRDFRTMERAFLFITIGIIFFEIIAYRVVVYSSLIIHCLPPASSAAICISYCIGELLSMKRRDMERQRLLQGCILISLLVLITCTSSGANVSAIVGCAIALVFSGKLFWAMLLFVCAGFLYLNPDLAEQLMMFVMPGKTKAVIESGNGRDTIWEGILAVAAQRPLLGWGYACGERVASVYLNWTLSDAHNNYLGIYGGLGIMGVSLLIIHQIITFLKTFNRKIRVGYVGLFCALFCASVNGYSYGYLSGKACSITVVYFALLVLTCMYMKVLKYDNKKTK